MCPLVTFVFQIETTITLRQAIAKNVYLCPMKLIQHIKASNLLSFGPDGLDLELGSLNVLVGPNGSGKSNFLEIFSLLRAMPRSKEESNSSLQGVIRRGGGVQEWIWKGDSSGIASLEILILYPTLKISVRHKIGFSVKMQVFGLDYEMVDGIPNNDTAEPLVFYRATPFDVTIERSGKIQSDEKDIELMEHNQGFNSVLSLRRDPIVYPLLSKLARSYEKIRLYREWNFGRNTIFREPQRADMRNDRLEEDFSNLGLYLNRLSKHPEAKRKLIIALRDLYEGLESYEVIIEGGSVQVFFTEGNFSIPATRLSDGSLRYLCLLAMLLDPTPPALICIEEPELGMHPDMLPKIADLLIEASERTQLIVTTHSDILIDALSDRPECVLVCEKHAGQTSIKRLDAENLKPWLEQYRLGQLWSMGEIGGNRW